MSETPTSRKECWITASVRERALDSIVHWALPLVQAGPTSGVWADKSVPFVSVNVSLERGASQFQKAGSSPTFMLAGACHVALVESVAVSTCPTVGAVAEETFTTV